MPELPEVETTRRGIEPHILKHQIKAVQVRESRLRWPVTPVLANRLKGEVVSSVSRRGKYLLLETARGTLVIHLGMSGSLRLVTPDATINKHDHVDIVFSHGPILRYTDPRRFGCVLWVEDNVFNHPLLRNLGPEPLSAEFNAEYLKARARGRKSAVKTFLMDSRTVVGVGNIYANEALFAAGIRPQGAAGRLAQGRFDTLVAAVKHVLQEALMVGGTTLRDFTDSEGQPGYFSQSLRVYGRGGLACLSCSEPLREIRIGQRSTVFCRACQR
ncbi:MAG: bifunctional DNA-formamidopyrimidine glycosylase/DNA-(apurinic or apyrimidinic site) lyase [Pseudohongiellaceae bacterium]